MSLFPPAPKPKSNLGYLRILSPTCGLRVSPLCIGAMSFGTNWKHWLGECDKKTTFEILDFYLDQGGNFIDTANNYQFGESEAFVGEWMADRNVRDQMVIATKYTTGDRNPDSGLKIAANTQGNHAKSLRISIENSLKRLQTSYIDILYLHWWDFSTSIPEVMQSLNHLVASGKVLYLGISDTPAWVVSKANEYARHHGLAQFVVYQGKWSAAQRDLEREIIPMCEAEGMAIAPWNAIGGGHFKSKEQHENEAHENRVKAAPDETVQKVSAKLEEIAKKKNTTIPSIALAYILNKGPYNFPIIGGRKIEHLKGNIEALSIDLSDEEISDIEGAAPFDIGFPMSFYKMNAEEGQFSNKNTTKDITLVQSVAHLDTVEKPRAIGPHKE